MTEVDRTLSPDELGYAATWSTDVFASGSFTALDEASGLARYELRPTTGKKHQLRVHMAALGIPIRHQRFRSATIA